MITGLNQINERVNPINVFLHLKSKRATSNQLTRICHVQPVYTARDNSSKLLVEVKVLFFQKASRARFTLHTSKIIYNQEKLVH
jgi:hypothetical protein